VVEACDSAGLVVRLGNFIERMARRMRPTHAELVISNVLRRQAFLDLLHLTQRAKENST
jgi:hypothetical protein